jgi:hypothetical protein
MKPRRARRIEVGIVRRDLKDLSAASEERPGSFNEFSDMAAFGVAIIAGVLA